MTRCDEESGLAASSAAFVARLVAVAWLAAALGPLGLARADTYGVTLDAELDDVVRPGRLILFFVTEQGIRWNRTPPAHGPFWSPPQPIFSVQVDGLDAGERIEIDGAVPGFPGTLDGLHGSVQVQAVLDVDDTERSHLDGPGNVLSTPLRVELANNRDDTVELVLEHLVEPARPPQDAQLMKWVRVRSDLLSDFYGRDVEHRCAVALPADHDDEALADFRWPVVYVIPGYGGRDEGARRYAMMLANENLAPRLPRAVFVVLDPESPLGHHGFVDSPNNGPRGTALVTELIPYLEERFHLRAEPAARVLTGHSSGGWSALWLQLRWPETFGGCWASAPDPVDFRAFQKTNLYQDASLYSGPDGRETGSLRERVTAEGGMAIVMTTREECTMEWSIHPIGGSGEQWDAWEAMFSPRDPATEFPQPMFDALTGEIDRAVVVMWADHDIGRLVREDWEKHGPIVMERVRLHCGELDSFYLDGAVRLFKRDVESTAAQNGGWQGSGYVELAPGQTHGSLIPHVRTRINDEMREHFRAHGLEPAPANSAH